MFQSALPYGRCPRNDVAPWGDDADDLRSAFHLSAPYFDWAMRRFSEGADVHAVAQETGAPPPHVSDVYVIYRWWTDPDKAALRGLDSVRGALMWEMFGRGDTVERVVTKLALVHYDVRFLRTSFEQITRLEARGLEEVAHPYRVDDVYVWLRNRQQQGATRVRLSRAWAGVSQVIKNDIPLQSDAPATLDAWRATRWVVWGVQDYQGPRGGQWTLKAYRGRREPPFCSTAIFEGREWPAPAHRWSPRMPLLVVTGIRRDGHWPSIRASQVSLRARLRTSRRA